MNIRVQMLVLKSNINATKSIAFCIFASENNEIEMQNIFLRQLSGGKRRKGDSLAWFKSANDRKKKVN